MTSPVKQLVERMPTRPEFGDPRLPERFWDKVLRAENGCWIWAGGTSGTGYGVTQYPTRDKNARAHRVSYMALVGPVNAETLDHLCRVRLCVNPAHLEPVSCRENVLRGMSPAAQQARQTHCKRGHPLSGDNLRTTRHGVGVQRNCRACGRSQWANRNKKVTP